MLHFPKSPAFGHHIKWRFRLPRPRPGPRQYSPDPEFQVVHRATRAQQIAMDLSLRLRKTILSAPSCKRAPLLFGHNLDTGPRQIRRAQGARFDRRWVRHRLASLLNAQKCPPWPWGDWPKRSALLAQQTGSRPARLAAPGVSLQDQNDRATH